MSTKTTVEVQPTEYNGAPARGVDRAPPVEIIHNSETGRTEPVVQGGGSRPSRTQVIERAKAKAKAAPAPSAAAAVADDEEVVGSGPAGEETPAAEAAEETPAAEPTPEAELVTEAAAEPAPETAADPASELDRAQARIEAFEREHKERQSRDLQVLIEDPKTAYRAFLADRMGVAIDHPEVDKELEHQKLEWTWGDLPVEDVPKEKQAELEMQRWRREQRLTKHRSKAEQEQRTRQTVEQRARDQAERSYRTVRERHPNLAVMAELDGRSVGDVVISTLLQAAKAGVIKPDSGDEAAFEEAIRLAEAHATTRAKNILSRLAHLATAPAPIKPGASSQQRQPAQPNRSQATPNQPRALPASKAGAAPSRPAEPAPTQPKRKVVDASAYEDPSDRRMDVLKRHARRP